MPVELEKQAQIAGIKAENEQITAVARNTAREKLFGTHPYASAEFRARSESVSKLTRRNCRPCTISMSSRRMA